MEDYPLSARIVRGVVICVVAFLSKLFWLWKIEDGEKLWNDHRGRVIIMNHVSFLETLLPSVQHVVPWCGRASHLQERVR